MTRKLATEGYTYIDVEIRHVTASAVLVHDGRREAWLPKSQIEDPEEFTVGEHTQVLIPEWLAADKGLI